MSPNAPLTSGANAPLSGPNASVTVSAARPVDVSAVLLSASGRVRSDNDLVFFNHPAQDGVALNAATVTVDFAKVPADVANVTVLASVDADRPGAVFDQAGTPQAEIVCGADRWAFEAVPLHNRETVVLLVEFYRRGTDWKVRALGQGYANGLAGMAKDFGIDVEEPEPVPTRSPIFASTPTPTPTSTSMPTPTPSASGPSAISLAKVQQQAPGLVDLYKSAEVSLQKKGLSGKRAAVYLVLDHSYSMKKFYKRGSMQHLADQVLGLSAHFDDDGVVPVVFFSTGVNLISDISLANHQGRVDALHHKMKWGGTTYAPAMQAVIDHHRDSGSADPAFVIFQTDGEPQDADATRALLRTASNLPIFWQFVGFGPERSLEFLSSLDTLTDRTVDNAGFFAAGRDPRDLNDMDVYEQLMNEFPAWLTAARAAGIIR